MHLQINLSNQLIRQWSPQLTDQPPETHPLLCWRIDKIKLGRTTANYICVNEATLFSFLLPALSGKKALAVQQLFVDRLRMFLQEYFFPSPVRRLFDQCPVFYGKSNSRALVGSVTNMRQLYGDFYVDGRALQEAEQRINKTPFSGRFPVNEFLKLRELFPKSSV